MFTAQMKPTKMALPLSISSRVTHPGRLLNPPTIRENVQPRWPDSTFLWLEKAIADRSNPAIFQRVRPGFDEL